MTDKQETILFEVPRAVALKLHIAMDRLPRYKGRSEDYIIEDALDFGLTELDRRFEKQQEAALNLAFVKALASNQALATDPEAMVKLMQKYKIGGTREEVQTFEDVR